MNWIKEILVAGESVVAATALPPQSKIAAGWLGGLGLADIQRRMQPSPKGSGDFR